MAITKLKRARNSLLNVSKLPPEIISEIFRWSATLRTDFGRLVKRSHNFLLVCHRWFEVASRTPDLWSFWGNNLQDWMKRHLQHPMAPLDLVFDGGPHSRTALPLNDSLRNALQDRATRDTIRRIHLATNDSDILDSILSPLAGCDGIRSTSVKSIIVQCGTLTETPRVSDLLAHYHFPKLQRLDLDECTISSWDLIMSKTSVLTSLTLNTQHPSPQITSFQLLSILRSNPSLQQITLYSHAIPGDGSSMSSRVPLAHLRELALAGPLQDVFTLLHQLNYPRDMENLYLHLSDGTGEDVSETIGPYVRDYFQRRGRSKSGLGLYLFSSRGTIQLSIGDEDNPNFFATELAWVDTLVTITIAKFSQGDTEEFPLSLLTYVPQEEITYCRARGTSISTEVMSAKLPYLREIYFEETPLHVAFPKSNPGRAAIFPHLQHIHINLGREVVPRGHWRTLTTFLKHLASSGNKLDILEIENPCDVDRAVESGIRKVVGEFRLTGGHYYRPKGYSVSRLSPRSNTGYFC